MLMQIHKLKAGRHLLGGHAGFPTGVDDMGGFSKFDWGGLSQYMGGAWGT